MNQAQKKNKHKEVMKRLQEEWVENEDFHKKTRYKGSGIRSSQISALIKFLIDIEVIKYES